MEITEKQKEYVLTHYGIVDTKIIALHLNTTPEYVRTIANRYGIKIKRQWTKEDMDYLRENWGETSLKVMSKKLKKTEIAIRTKAGREGLGGYIENGSYITLMDLARAIDRDKYESTYRKLINANIPFYIKKVQYKKVKVIEIEKFWSWAEKNKEKLNFSKLEKFILGKEPKWVDEKRLYDSKIIVRKPWTLKEEMELRQLAKKHTKKEIAVILNRTLYSIRRRCNILKITTVVKIPKKKWTSEEYNLLLQKIREGYNYKQLIVLLNKNENQLRKKLFCNFGTGKLEEVRKQLEME